MLNEVPNNNDITHIAKVMLKEVSNSNDNICIVNNVCLSTMGAQ